MSSKLGDVEYVIFDVDGLLSDSETIYTKVTNDILARYGKTMTWEIKAGIMGKVQREAAEYIYSFFPGLENELSVDDYLVERNALQDDLFRKVLPLRGAVQLVRHLHDAGIPIALATGSNARNFKLKTDHLPEIFALFPSTRILTADSPQVKPGRGKPNPDIFLAAAQSLGYDVGTATDCSDLQRAQRAKGLVFEDAVPGVKAGVAAGMNVVWVPDPQLRALNPSETYGAKLILESLDQWDPVAWGLSPMKVSQPSLGVESHS
ncbi:HAD-like domain-containing protein [Kockovaella imperatae]|uniref:HAD-like domain-containing protein n=1 Tax=Kockovaella imperatae TaxID=4999 RepID=A0A1Y1UGI0_9TREE|nr:HAD-like domain-containing protein [Kockovaella imperatae]ORX36614.1 HAD-like domain-containing protein [Kockovaella imperatae]